MAGSRPVPPKKGLKGLDPAVERSRKRGALLGLAVGDALGSTLQGRRLPGVSFPSLADGPHTEMKGGGAFALKPGQVTNETQTACCLAESLKTLKRYDVAEVIKQYRQWQPLAFDVDKQTAEVLDLIASGRHYELAAREVWLSSSRRTAGDGALARATPLGVFFAQDKDKAARTRSSIEDAALTHFDPRCQLACAAFNASIAAAVRAPAQATADQVAGAATAELALAGASLGSSVREFVNEVKDATLALSEDLARARAPDPQLYGPELHLHHHQGFVRVAFRLAYWQLFHAPSFEAGLLDVVNRGGAADSNAAIAGALLGAVHGEQAIPARWRTPVLEALSVPGRGPLWDRYHPLRLLELAD